MNKRLIAVLCAVLALAVACGIAVAGCKKKDAPATDQVTVTVAYVDGTDPLGPTVSVDVNVPKDATVYDALVATGFQIDAEDAQWGKYVHGIAGIQDSSNTGWVYTEDGNEVMEGSDAHTVVPGATYLWTLISW